MPISKETLCRLHDNDPTLTELCLPTDLERCLDNNIFDDGDACVLATALQHNTILAELRLMDINIGLKGAKALAEALQKNTRLMELCLRNSEIGPKGAEVLSAMLIDNNALTNLRLIEDNIRDAGAIAVAAALDQNTTLSLLNLARNNIGDDGAIALAIALHHNGTLTELSLGVNDIGPKGAEALAEALQKNTTLMELGLYNNKIGAKGATSLSKMLIDNTTLTLLSLGGNGIGDAGAKALAQALLQNTTLRTLNLNINNIGLEGAEGLADVLINHPNPTLTKLYLGDNDIADAGAEVLATALQQNTRLEQLCLRDNHIGDGGAIALARALENNGTLTMLSLFNNNIGGDGACALATALKNNDTLTELMLHNSNIGDRGACALAEALMHNTTLRSLNLNSSNIGAEGVHALANALKHNTTLNTLYAGSIPGESNYIIEQLERRNRLIEQIREQRAGVTTVDLRPYEFNNNSLRGLIAALKRNTLITTLLINPQQHGIDQGCDEICEIIALLERNRHIAEREANAPKEISTLAYSTRPLSRELMLLPDELCNLVDSYILEREPSVKKWPASTILEGYSEAQLIASARTKGIERNTLKEGDEGYAKVIAIFNNIKNRSIDIDGLREYLLEVPSILSKLMNYTYQETLENASNDELAREQYQGGASVVQGHVSEHLIRLFEGYIQDDVRSSTLLEIMREAHNSLLKKQTTFFTPQKAGLLIAGGTSLAAGILVLKLAASTIAAAGFALIALAAALAIAAVVIHCCKSGGERSECVSRMPTYS